MKLEACMKQTDGHRQPLWTGDGESRDQYLNSSLWERACPFNIYGHRVSDSKLKRRQETARWKANYRWLLVFKPQQQLRQAWSKWNWFIQRRKPQEVYVTQPSTTVRPIDQNVCQQHVSCWTAIHCRTANVFYVPTVYNTTQPLKCIVHLWRAPD